MTRYPLEVCIHIEVDAPSLEDARLAVEDVFGAGEMEDFDMTITSFDVKEL
jgi:hypothetical protein